ncbi:MAG: hypothetical protein LBV20_00055 [Treponema sp.]|jgi:hypothetical protein|nr:hypothetical protein [Treponema sp.]
MRNKCACVFVILILCFLSCKHTIDPVVEIDFSFTSPKAEWQYYSDERILFSLNVDTDLVLWSSSLDGDLGKGNHMFASLSPGIHTITAEFMGSLKTMTVSVVRRIIEPGTEIKTLINYSPLSNRVPSYSYSPYLITLDGSISGFSINSSGNNSSKYSSLKQSRMISVDSDKPLRDIHLPLTMPARGTIIQSERFARSGRNAAVQKNMLPGQMRTFSVVNTASQFAEPHEIEAELYHVSDSLSVWIAKDSLFDEAELIKCIEAAETVIIPRVELLWGSSADIDEDGRVAILVSPSINTENLAVGFFNPADFFKRNTDASSESYNPASNEMDIIYIAVPQSDDDSSYNSATIIATIAHELTHAVTFSVKTWQRITEGDDAALQEELFLNEGWSHLTENLCGYGVSGGNIKFLQRYFEDTAAYSLCGPNRLGQNDSPGMRGGMTLFLSWLFWKKGGITWDENNPLLFTDKGGISFLQKMLQSPLTGWDSIGASFGTETDVLFQQMVSEINMQRIENRIHESIPDPLTKEPVDFFSNMIFSYEGNSVHIDFPVARNQSEYQQDRIVPWSFQLFHAIDLSNPQELDTAEIIISAEKYNGTMYYNLCPFSPLTLSSLQGKFFLK